MGLSIVEFDSLTLTNTGGDASRHEEMAVLKDASAIPVADLDPNTASRGRDNCARLGAQNLEELIPHLRHACCAATKLLDGMC